MSAGVIKSQGTELFIIDPTGSDPKVVKFLCPTGITGLGSGAKSQIDVTCLDADEDQEFIGGLGGPGAMSVPFNFIPTAESHQGVLTDLRTHKGNLKFMVCMEDGKSAPTLDSNGGFNPPANRTSVWFEGYISEVSIDIATNEKVVGNMTIQRSGKTHPTFPTV